MVVKIDVDAPKFQEQIRLKIGKKLKQSVKTQNLLILIKKESEFSHIILL